VFETLTSRPTGSPIFVLDQQEKKMQLIAAPPDLYARFTKTRPRPSNPDETISTVTHRRVMFVDDTLRPIVIGTDGQLILAALLDDYTGLIGYDPEADDDESIVQIIPVPPNHPVRWHKAGGPTVPIICYARLGNGDVFPMIVSEEGDFLERASLTGDYNFVSSEW
jgi:hypothetical protein